MKSGLAVTGAERLKGCRNWRCRDHGSCHRSLLDCRTNGRGIRVEGDSEFERTDDQAITGAEFSLPNGAVIKPGTKIECPQRRVSRLDPDFAVPRLNAVGAQTVRAVGRRADHVPARAEPHGFDSPSLMKGFEGQSANRGRAVFRYDGRVNDSNHGIPSP